MFTYIHELPDWPSFRWDQGGLAKQLAAVRLRQGRLIGRMQALGFRQQEEAVLTTLTEDVLKSSEIEGEILDKNQVRSSIARRLGIEAGALVVPLDRPGPCPCASDRRPSGNPGPRTLRLRLRWSWQNWCSSSAREIRVI